MPSFMDKAKDKLPGRRKSSVQGGSPKGSSKGSPKGSPNGRSIPPEPVQQMLHGDFTESDADPAMQAHNLARVTKSCNKLEWDAQLSKEALEYAEQLASQKKMQHSGVEGQGENVFMSTGNALLEDAVQSWLNEEKKYNGEKIGEGNLQDWGHYSQCVWSTTKHVGMGKATSSDGKTYIVARYTPPGNMSGERPY